MKFEWDKKKDEANLQKHGIRFDEAKTIFYGPVLIPTVKNKPTYHVIPRSEATWESPKR